MKKALVDENIVINIVEVDKDNIPNWCRDWPEALENAEIGGTYINGLFTRKVTLTPAASVPTTVSRFQAKAALAQVGKLVDAEAAVAASNNVVLQLAWAEANEFRRNSPGINALAPMIGLDAAGLDALFIAAAQIEA